jgi:hypothetical protein
MVPRSMRLPLRARSMPFLIAILAVGCWAVSACSPSATPTPSSSPPASSPVGPSLTPVPGGSNVATPPPTGQLPTQTDTEWGRIWDGLPPSFPLAAGSVPTETREGPASATLALGMSVEQASDLVVAGLIERGSRVDRGDPSEDGSVVIDALGPAPACEIQVRLTPLSGTTSMVVMFGAGCPFE